MQTLLLAEPSDIFAAAIIEKLRGNFEFIHCQDGESALDVLSKQKPDVLIVNMSLPFKDGLTLLQETPHKPGVIIGITDTHSPYVMNRSRELGADDILIMPKPSTVMLRVADLILWKNSSNKASSETNIDMILHMLQVPAHRTGYQPLRTIITMYHDDPAQSLSKHLYPAVAKACDFQSSSAVEQNIRRVIQAAWKVKENAVWSKFFDVNRKTPTNLEFIARIARALD